MTVISSSIQISTHPNYHMVDITSQVSAQLSQSGLQQGIVTIFLKGATGAITTIEYEPGLVRDMEECCERFAPQQQSYHHEAQWHDGNGHAHIRASLLGPSLTVPFVNGRMTLGTWQQIVLIDFDVPARQRQIIIQIMGE